MINRWIKYLHSTARAQLYSREQWFALVLGLICLGVDVFAMSRTVQSAVGKVGPGNLALSASGPVMGMVEVVLAFAVLALLLFAFSRHPDTVLLDFVPDAGGVRYDENQF